MKRQFPEVPILGLTATATTKVLEDVKKILNIPHCYLFKASFNRPNLFYEVCLLEMIKGLSFQILYLSVFCLLTVFGNICRSI